jgi:hypothetical protein
MKSRAPKLVTYTKEQTAVIIAYGQEHPDLPEGREPWAEFLKTRRDMFPEDRYSVGDLYRKFNSTRRRCGIKRRQWTDEMDDALVKYVDNYRPGERITRVEWRPFLAENSRLFGSFKNSEGLFQRYVHVKETRCQVPRTLTRNGTATVLGTSSYTRSPRLRPVPAYAGVCKTYVPVGRAVYTRHHRRPPVSEEKDAAMSIAPPMYEAPAPASVSVAGTTEGEVMAAIELDDDDDGSALVVPALPLLLPLPMPLGLLARAALSLVQ